MRKIRFALTMLLTMCVLIAAALTGCDETADNGTGAPTIKDYFPMKANTLYEYEGVDNDKLNQIMYNGYAEDGIVQRHIKAGSINTTEVISYKDGKLVLVYAEGNRYNYENQFDAKQNLGLVLMQEPLKEGQSWSTNGTDKTTIVSMYTPITTPYGDVETMEIKTEYGNDMEATFYYAKGIGLVKAENRRPDMNDVYMLKSVTEDTARESVMVFFYSENGDTTLFEDRIVSLRTNDDVIKIVESELKVKGDKFIPLLAEEDSINSIDIDREIGTATIDLSSSFLDNLPDGKQKEQEILDCLINTVGNIYGVASVRITISGEAYSSRNITMKDGLFYPVFGQQADDNDLDKIVADLEEKLNKEYGGAVLTQEEKEEETEEDEVANDE